MDEEARVGGHLGTLATCHYVYAGLAVLMAAFHCAFMLFMRAAIERSQPWQGTGSSPSQEFPLAMFDWMLGAVGVVIVLWSLTIAVLCVLSARGLAARRSRTLSLVVAGILCVTGVLGIALGVFTFIVLLKPETERLYAATPPAA